MVWGDGKIIRDYIHIDDLTNCVCLLLINNIKNEIINIGTGKGTSVNELVKIISEATKKDLNIKYQNSRLFDVAYNVLDIGKAKKMINWRPAINLIEGITNLCSNSK